MQFIIDGFLALALLLAGAWLWSVQVSLARDRAVTAREEADAAARQAQAEREARLHRRGERLHCLSCGKSFRGPLPEDGCPRCHLAAFVVPKDETERLI